MTNQPFLYDAQANVLRQRAEMEEPSWDYGFPEGGPSDSLLESAYADYNYRCEEYSAHLASLPAYTPVSGWVPEVGKEYYEGKDFQAQNKDENDRCPECGHEEYEDEVFLGKGFRVCAICHQEWWLDVKYNSIYSKLAVPIEQKQEGSPKCTCQNEGQYMSCTIRCERIIAEEEEGEKQEQPRAFSIQDMIECWEAGRKSGFWTPILSRTDKKQYFKSKFNINIDDQGK